MRFLKGRTGQDDKQPQKPGIRTGRRPENREFKMLPFAGAPKEKAGGDGERQQHGSSDGTFCLCVYLPSVQY